MYVQPWSLRYTHVLLSRVKLSDEPSSVQVKNDNGEKDSPLYFSHAHGANFSLSLAMASGLKSTRFLSTALALSSSMSARALGMV